MNKWTTKIQLRYTNPNIVLHVCFRFKKNLPLKPLFFYFSKTNNAGEMVKKVDYNSGLKQFLVKNKNHNNLQTTLYPQDSDIFAK